MQAIIVSRYNPNVERRFSTVQEGIEAILDVWEHNHNCTEHSFFDRNLPSVRADAELEARDRLWEEC